MALCLYCDVFIPYEKINHYYWYADFVVSFDDDMEAGTFNLAGQYDLWSENWVDIDSSWLGKDYVKGEEIRLLGEVGSAFNSGNPISVSTVALTTRLTRTLARR